MHFDSVSTWKPMGKELSCTLTQESNNILILPIIINMFNDIYTDN